MKFGKKTISILAAGLTCVSIFAVSVSANTSSKSVAGYGTLTGESFDVSTNTYVTKNPDNAYLTARTVVQDVNGKQLLDSGILKSNRGATSFGGGIYQHPINTYVLYGTHGVQGGTSYGAQAVYTYTHAPS